MPKNEGLSKETMELLNRNPDMISNPVLKAAVEKFNKEQSEIEAEMALEAIRTVSGIVENEVASLRRIRVAEKNQHGVVKAVDKAKVEFFKDGDVEKFLKAHRDAVTTNRR